MTESMLNWVLSVWGTGVQKVQQILTTNVATNSETWQLVLKLHSFFQGTGYTLILICFALSMIKTGITLSDLRRPEVAITQILRFLVAKIIIDKGLDLMILLMNLGRSLIAGVFKISCFSPGQMVLPEEIVNALNKEGFFQSILVWVVAFIGVMIMIVQTLVVVMTVYGRLLKIYVLAAFSPLPMSTLAGEPTQNIAFHFLKTFTGVCLEGVIMAVAIIIYSTLIRYVPAGVSGESTMVMLISYLVSVIFQTLILAGLIKGADQLMARIMGT